jgi:nucleotide-binding universal stress UspA family protein
MRFQVTWDRWSSCQTPKRGRKVFKRILLPLDGSRLAEQAIPYAVVQAKSFGAELILLRLFEPLRGTSGVSRATLESVERRINALAREYLEHVAVGIQEQNISVQVITTRGHPHHEIVRFAEANQVDLLLICTRGHSGFNRWLMGSVADRVIRGASSPVLLVRARKEETQERES